jgi:hypothetical protein
VFSLGKRTRVDRRAVAVVPAGRDGDAKVDGAPPATSLKEALEVILQAEFAIK